MQSHWVGLTDFYEESLCLLLSRLSAAAASAVFSRACRCDLAASILDVPVQTHGSVDSAGVDVHPVLAAKLDRLTAVDKALFSLALRGFFSEIKALEANIGRRIMCAHVLQNAEPKLAYIANVTALYEAVGVD